MIGATISEFETQKQVKFNLRDFLDTLIQKNGRGSKSRRVQRFCDKYNFSQAEYESIRDQISSNRFMVVI